MLKLKLEYIDPQAKRSEIEPNNVQPIPMKLIKLPAGFGCEEFYLAETPITEAQWCAVMGGEATQPDYPKVEVNYHDTQEFCRKASESYGVEFRLPTEFEWCRAVGVEPEPECLHEYAVFDHNAIEKVKTKLPNEFGLYDMRGLVWEWLSGQAVDDCATMRGGAWRSSQMYARAVYRSYPHPGLRDYLIGFRVVVVSPKQVSK